ncbi:MAG: M14 family zinc carboxypeptidase [Gemmatimonadota bacterium]
MSRLVLRALLTATLLAPGTALAQQAVDEEYTRLIAEHLQDARISTELVDHLPASETVPTPLDFHGRIIGTPGELTYAADIHRYLRAIADASPRARVWSIGESEEGREMIVMAIADESTIADLEDFGGYLAELTDPRVTPEERAEELIEGVAKPIYWVTSGMHSGETGGPEMLQELAYRLVVEDTDFIRAIRNNIITFITPVIEVDGRERMVDTYYFNKDRPEGEARLPLMYWGKYVAHDNNRDAMGQMLALTQHINRTFLEWTPTVLHDLHEAQTYLYSSTGTGPYNEAFDAITIGEWWVLAENDVLEMTKRDVPGVWTYAFYDGWTPNYMFSIAHAHNAIGRFYEVMSYGPDNRPNARASGSVRSREWYRPNPPLEVIDWGPRNNTNIQESALLFSLKYTADHADWFLENYWLKNKRAVQRGVDGPVYAWVIPANQRRKSDAAQAVNDLMTQGLEFHRADDTFEVDGIQVQAGDYIVRGDQPYRSLADIYLSLQAFSLDNPRPYDDTGWTFQLMRNLELEAIEDPDILEREMSEVAAPVMAVGGVYGRGDVLVVDHTSDNALVTFRFRHADVPMMAAEEDFELNDHPFRAGAFIIPDADRAAMEASLTELGLSAWATGDIPDVPTHELDVPRIGYVHSWRRTQDEGWVRGAFDYYRVPYTYFADQKLREGRLRERYDVIVFPHVGGDATSQVNGIDMSGELPLPYRKTEDTPNLGGIDESDDIRGGMGLEGLLELAKFVQEGGTLIVEGSTANIFPSYGLTDGVTVEEPEGLIAPGSVHRGIIADQSSPIAYGFSGEQVPVYFKNDLVLNAGGGGLGRFARFFGGGGTSTWQNTTPMANRPRLSPWEQEEAAGRGEGGQPDAMAEFRQMARSFGVNVGGDGGARVVMRFPQSAEQMLLSGALGGGEALQGRAQVVDASVGDGHVVMFAIRPFWRWQTQGNYFLGFNAILNWNDLNAGIPQEDEEQVTEGGGR